MADLLTALVRTAHSAGLNLMSAERAARILAVLYVFGGDHESFTHKPRWLTAVKMATARSNVFGGFVPDAEVAALIKERVKELAPSGILGPRTVTDWARGIADEYGLHLHKNFGK